MIAFEVLNVVEGTAPSVTPVDVDTLPLAAAVSNAATVSPFTGDKFFGGFGTTEFQIPDYWTLRARSSQLFTENLYARGIVRRLVTNEINTGLVVESVPDERTLGAPEGSMLEWSENVEARFTLWGRGRVVCDFRHEDTFGALQRAARLEALVSGDVLVALRVSPATRGVQVQLIRGDRVQSPLGSEGSPKSGNKITHGVEVNPLGRVAAYWVLQDDGGIKRLPAYGEKSGRRLAWLVYGTDKRLDDLRGMPLLAIILQSLKELDRNRDAAQRKKLIHSILAMFIEKTDDKPGTLPFTGASVRRDTIDTTDTNGDRRRFNLAQQVPGVVFENLQKGERPVGFSAQGADDRFGEFEEIVLSAIAWANEIPPEILRLAFSNNYSASQAAINEFKIYLNKVWSDFGENFCEPIFSEWLINEVLLGRIEAPGLADLWRDGLRYDMYAAYIATEWYGSIKPSTDVLKQAKGARLLINEGLSTRTREARNSTGTSFAKNIKRLERENAQLAAALAPIVALQDKINVDSEVVQ